jgi:hypothetical protein
MTTSFWLSERAFARVVATLPPPNMAILLMSQEFSFEFKESAERMGKSTSFSRCILGDKELSFLSSAQRNLDGSA